MSALALIKAFMHSKCPLKDAVYKGVLPSWKDKNEYKYAVCSGKKGEQKQNKSLFWQIFSV